MEKIQEQQTQQGEKGSEQAEPASSVSVAVEKDLNDGQTLVRRRADGTIMKGVVLNRRGNPGARHLTTLLREALQRTYEGDPLPLDHMIIEKVADMAKNGDSFAIKHIWDRMEGTAPQTLVLEGGNFNSLSHEQRKKLSQMLEANLSEENISLPAEPIELAPAA